ncbi:hypothetical protein LIA77_11293 [Sarocladium implicatum]|nr:hypothetical protein LIA77_11293 [Sarocladium implicatum]
MVRLRGLSLALSLSLALGAQAEAKQHVPGGLDAASGAPSARSLSIRDSLARGDDPVELYKSVIMARAEAEAKGHMIDVPEEDLRAILDKIEELREDVDDLLSGNADEGAAGREPGEKNASNKDKASDSDSSFDADAILDSASFKQKLPMDKADIDAAVQKSGKDKAMGTKDESTTTTTISSTSTRTVTLTRVLEGAFPFADATDAAKFADVKHKAVSKPAKEAANHKNVDNKEPAQTKAEEALTSIIDSVETSTPEPEVKAVKGKANSAPSEAPEAASEEVTSIQPSTTVVSIETPEPSSSTESSSASASGEGPKIKIAKPEEEDSPMLVPSPTPVDPATPATPVIQTPKTPNLSFTLPAGKPSAKVAKVSSDSPFPTPVEVPEAAASSIITELTPSVPPEVSSVPTSAAASVAPEAETVETPASVPVSVPVAATPAPSGFTTLVKS